MKKLSVNRYRDLVAFYNLSVIALDFIVFAVALIAWFAGYRFSSELVFWLALMNLLAWIGALSDNGEGLDDELSGAASDGNNPSAGQVENPSV